MRECAAMTEVRVRGGDFVGSAMFADVQRDGELRFL